MQAISPREILERGPVWVDRFIDYHKEHLSDVSDRPEIKQESIQFWMMSPEGSETLSRKRRRAKARYAIP